MQGEAPFSTPGRIAGMKVLIIGSMANVAGAAVALLRLARGLRERGCRTRAVFLYERLPVPSSDHPYDVVVNSARPSKAEYLAMVGRVHALMRAEKPDVVISLMPLAHIVAQSAALMHGVKRRIAAHRSPIDTYDAPLRQLNRLYARAGVYTGVSAVSHATMASCAGYPKRLLERASTIHNAILDWPETGLKREEARASFGFPEGRVVLAAIGRHVAQKNYALLVEVARKLDPKFLIAIAGEGPLRAQFEASAAAAGVSDRFAVLGALARERVADLLVASDVYIMPSLFEGNSNSLLEALTSGRPIIAHDIPEQREVLVAADGSRAGILVPLNSVEGWVQGIEQLDRDDGARARLCEVAVGQNDQFSFRRMIDKYEELILKAG